MNTSMRSAAFAILIVLTATSCSTVPKRESRLDTATDTAGPPEEVQAPEIDELIQWVEDSLSSKVFVPTVPEGPMIVPLKLSTLGLAQGTNEVVIWRLGEHSFHTEKIPLMGDILSFSPINPNREQPVGFHARMSGDSGESDLFVLENGKERPFFIMTPASATNQTAVTDVDGDGRIEMIQYARVFEAAGRRELIIDLSQWDGGSFTHLASIPLLRRLNKRLTALEQELTSPTSPTRSARLNTALLPSEDAPPAIEMLPAVEARVPLVDELMLNLKETSWRISHELALFPGPAIYRINIDLRAYPVDGRSVQVVGLDT